MKKQAQREEPSSSAKAAAKPRVGGPKVYTSPAEILCQMSPPQCTISINFNDVRFVAKFHVDHERWTPFEEFNNRSKSRRFRDADWKTALASVHKWCWEKWDVCRDIFPLEEDMAEQQPGHVPAELLSALQPTVLKAGPPKKYERGG